MMIIACIHLLVNNLHDEIMYDTDIIHHDDFKLIAETFVTTIMN